MIFSKSFQFSKFVHVSFSIHRSLVDLKNSILKHTIIVINHLKNLLCRFRQVEKRCNIIFHIMFPLSSTAIGETLVPSLSRQICASWNASTDGPSVVPVRLVQLKATRPSWPRAIMAIGRVIAAEIPSVIKSDRERGRPWNGFQRFSLDIEGDLPPLYRGIINFRVERLDCSPVEVNEEVKVRR